MIRKMALLALWGVSSAREEIIEELHSLGVLQIEQKKILPDEQSGKLSNLRLLRSKLLGLIESLGWKDWKSISEAEVDGAAKILSDLPAEELIDEIEISLEEFSRRLASLIQEKSSSEETLSRARRTMDTLLKFSSFFRRRQEEGPGRSSLWWISENHVPEALKALSAGVLSTTGHEWKGRHHFVRGQDFMGVLAVRLPPVFDSQGKDILAQYKALPWQLTEFCPQGAAERYLPAVEKKASELSKRIKEIDGDLEKTALEWGPRLAALFLYIDGRTAQAAVETHLESSGDSFTIHGWIPEDALPSTVASLKERFGGKIHLQWKEPDGEEEAEAPTALKNSPLSSPFELFLKLLRPPSYGGVDPTAAIALFFPFFSGCMVGDIGYGAVLLLIALALKRSAGALWRDVGSILLFVAGWSILWGVAWGEFFGDIGHRLFHLEPLWVERSESIQPVMAFTVALGAAHVFFGLFIGIYQGLRNKQRHVWMEKTGNLAVLLALTGGLVFLKAELPKGFFTLPLSLLVVGIALLIWGGGIGGIIDALGSVGNIISYVRIAAIGLSSAILAMVASTFLDVFGVSVLGIFLALTIHLMNFVLAIGGSSLHSARLHYVEFFGKFYSGSGREYTPFKRRSGSSWKKHS